MNDTDLKVNEIKAAFILNNSELCKVCFFLFVFLYLMLCFFHNEVISILKA